MSVPLRKNANSATGSTCEGGAVPLRTDHPQHLGISYYRVVTEGKLLPGMPLASSIQDGYALLKRLKLRLIEAVVHTSGIQELLVGASFYDLSLF